MQIWKYGNREKRKLGTLDIRKNDIQGNWKLGKIQIWKNANLEKLKFGIMETWKMETRNNLNLEK